MNAFIKHPPIRHLLALAVLSVVGLQAQAAVAGLPATYSGVYVFGDSLSDNGNNRLALPNAADGATQIITGNSYIPSLPYASGVYSNGPVWFNAYATGLGLPLFAAPSLAGGGDYAYGGARTNREGDFGGFPPSLPTQLNGFLSSSIGVSPTAIYVLAGGGNDVRDVGDAIGMGTDPTVATTAGATAFATRTAMMVGQLQAAGATPKNIVVWNVPNVGLAPASLASGPEVAGGASAIAGAFNGALSFALAGTGVTIFDLYGLITTVVATPGAYGLSNVSAACGFAGNDCNPATALFWDGIHPTAAGHALVANAMLAAVPEPGAVWLFMAGLLTVGALRLRRR